MLYSCNDARSLHPGAVVVYNAEPPDDECPLCLARTPRKLAERATEDPLGVRDDPELRANVRTLAIRRYLERIDTASLSGFVRVMGEEIAHFDPPPANKDQIREFLADLHSLRGALSGLDARLRGIL